MRSMRLLAGLLTTLSFRDCSTFKFRVSPKLKIPSDSRQPQVSNGTNHVILPHWERGKNPNDSKLDNFLLMEKRLLPFSKQSLDLSPQDTLMGMGYMGSYKPSLNIHATCMLMSCCFGQEPCSCLHAVQICNFRLLGPFSEKI